MDRFPQIMPFTASGNEVGGYITAMHEEFYVHLTSTGEFLNRKIHLKGCRKLHQVLEPVLHNLEQHLKQCHRFEDMLSELQNALEQQLCSGTLKQSSSRHIDCTALFLQLQACGWESVVFINSEFNEIHLKAYEESGREHILKVWISDKFPSEGPRCESEFPQEFQYKWFPGDSLLSMFTAFQETLETYRKFWNNMDEIDKNTWVLEPEKPTRKDCRRRIALTSGISLLIVVNPLMPMSIPTCHYLGPERIVEPVREKFNKNIHSWSEYDSILQNLQQVLEIEFPSPASSVKEEFCMECGICYSYLLGEAIPDMTCENQNCNQPFHHACLYEYIRTLPDVRSSFNKLFGNCPYCSKPLWCTIP